MQTGKAGAAGDQNSVHAASIHESLPIMEPRSRVLTDTLAKKGPPLYLAG
jgi:hypothetical protein